VRPRDIFRSTLLLGALFGLGAAARAADDMPVAAERQVPLLLKILTYDRQLEVKAGRELVIGIVCSPLSPASAKAREEVLASLDTFVGKTVKKLPLQFWWQDYTNPDKLAAWVKAKRISVLYVSPGNEKNLPAILKISQENRVTSITGVPDYVERGVAVGIGERQAKPLILINLASSKLEGSEFDASLLRIATIVK
jgi:hypothetical protein